MQVIWAEHSVSFLFLIIDTLRHAASFAGVNTDRRFVSRSEKKQYTDNWNGNSPQCGKYSINT